MTPEQIAAVAGKLTLTERLQAATGPDRELDAEIFIALCWPDWRIQTNCDDFPEEVRPGRIQEPNGCGWRKAPIYTASIDAVLTLLPDGWAWAIGHSPEGSGHPIGTASVFELGGAMHKGAGATPAIALLLAICQARGIE